MYSMKLANQVNNHFLAEGQIPYLLLHLLVALQHLLSPQKDYVVVVVETAMSMMYNLLDKIGYRCLYYSML